MRSSSAADRAAANTAPHAAVFAPLGSGVATVGVYDGPVDDARDDYDPEGLSSADILEIVEAAGRGELSEFARPVRGRR